MAARTTLGLYGSAVSGASQTIWTFAAQAVRSMVPRLPGSRTRSRIRINWGDAGILSSGMGTTAAIPAGVSVSVTARMTAPFTSYTSRVSFCRSTTSCRRRASVSKAERSKKTRAGTTPALAASATSRVPSMRNCLAARRSFLRARLRASFTLSFATLVITAIRSHRGERALRCGGGLGRTRLVGDLDERFERSRIAHGKVGEDFAIYFDPRQFQTVHQLVVGGALFASGGVNACNPEAAKFAFAVVTIAVVIKEGVGQRLVRPAVQEMARADLPLGLLE